MSETDATEVLPSYEAEIVRLYPEVVTSLEALRNQVRATVMGGAQLGAMIFEAQRTHRARFWSWLAQLPGCRDAAEEVIRFAMRAYKARERDPALGDPAQLTFALVYETQVGDGDGRREPQSSDGGEFVALVKNLQRDMALVSKLVATQPVERWSPVLRDNVARALRPLMDLARRLGV